MAINRQLLDCLVCPMSREKLHEADVSFVDAVNGLIAKGALTNQKGDTLTQPIDGGLLRADLTVLYPIHDDIPNLLVDEAIDVSKIAGK